MTSLPRYICKTSWRQRLLLPSNVTLLTVMGVPYACILPSAVTVPSGIIEKPWNSQTFFSYFAFWCKQYWSLKKIYRVIITCIFFPTSLSSRVLLLKFGRTKSFFFPLKRKDGVICVIQLKHFIISTLEKRLHAQIL